MKCTTEVIITILKHIVFAWDIARGEGGGWGRGDIFAMTAHVVLHLVRRKTWRSIQDKFYKSKTSSRFPNFDASNAWQMGDKSTEGIFLGQELLLDFAVWLELSLNADNTIMVYQLPSKFQDTFWFFETCWWLTGLSRLYDGSQPPGRHTRYFKTMLKILVDRALMRHISFFVRWYFVWRVVFTSQ